MNERHRYSARVMWSAEDEGFIATVPEFPGVSAFGQTRDEAIAELDKALEAMLDAYGADGREAPEPDELREYSGQFRVRVPRSLHRRLAEFADREDTSLNTLVVSLLSHALGQRTAPS